MIEKTLRPIKDLSMYSDKIAQLLTFELYYDIFRPLFDELGVEVAKAPKDNAVEVRGSFRWNKAGSSLDRALQSGRVVYSDGYFYGQFSAAITKELRAMGGVFNKTKKAFRVDNVPMDVKATIASVNAQSRMKAKDILDRLDDISKESISIKVGEYVGSIFDDLQKQFVRTVKAADYEVPMVMTEGIREAIAEDYTYNLNLYINKWKQEQIERLRYQVQENVEQGFRSDIMVEQIKSEYGISQTRAKFIARQETSLLVSKYREARYKESGLNEYIWSTSHDERVRPDHKELDGKRFSWDAPPVVDRTTGRKGNPGEDFNCRCVAIPVLRIGGREYD